MPMQLSGYENNTNQKELFEITVTKNKTRTYLDVNSPTPFEVRQDFESGYLPIYIGEAYPGVDKDETGWRIRKITYVGNNQRVISWANGTADFDKIWDDRATYTYNETP